MKAIIAFDVNESITEEKTFYGGRGGEFDFGVVVLVDVFVVGDVDVVVIVDCVKIQ